MKEVALFLSVALLTGCGPEAAELIVVVRYGDLDPLEIPNSSGNVDLLSLEIVTDTDSTEIGLDIPSGPTFDREINVAPSTSNNISRSVLTVSLSSGDSRERAVLRRDPPSLSSELLLRALFGRFLP